MRRVTFGALALALLPAAAHGQTTRADPTDLQAWVAVGVTADLPARWEAQFRYRARFVDDARAYRGSYLNAEVSRGIRSGIRALAGYRLALVEDAKAHRFSAGFNAEADVGDLELSVRPVLQHQQEVPDDDAESGSASTLLRTRGRVRYTLHDNVNVYASTEPFFNLNGDDDYFIDNIRNTLGVTWKYGGGRSVDVFYIYRPDYARAYNRTFHVIGVDFDFETRPLRRRETP